MKTLFSKLDLIDKWKWMSIPYIVSLFLLGVYVFSKLEIVKVLIFAITIISIIIFRKKRVCYLLLLSSFSLILVMNNYNMGSFFTWSLIAYYFIVCLELLFKKELKRFLNRRTVICFLLCLIIVLAYLFNLRTASFIKTISLIVYLVSPIFFFADFYRSRSVFPLIVCIVMSFLLSNLFAFIFVYLLKGMTTQFLSLVLPKWLKYYQFNNGSFRFSGLNDDPNYNSFFSLFLTSLCLVLLFSVKSKSKKAVLVILSILMQPFAILGMSKTYFIILIVLALYSLFVICFITRINSDYIPILLMSLSLVSIPFVTLFSSTILRIMSSDTRVGFLSSFTTGRSDLFISYLSEFTKEPASLLFGHGAHAKPITNLNDMHNTILRIIWDTGLIGSTLYITYYFSFILFRTKNKNILLVKITPIIVLVCYIFALDLASNHILLFSLFSFSLIEIKLKERIGGVFYVIEI